MLTQLPSVPSLIPSSFATRAIGRDVSITIFTASSLNSGEKLFFGRGNYFTFPDVHPIGWTVRKLRGTPHVERGEHQRSAGRACQPAGRQRGPALPERVLPGSPGRRPGGPVPDRAPGLSGSLAGAVREDRQPVPP